MALVPVCVQAEMCLLLSVLQEGLGNSVFRRGFLDGQQQAWRSPPFPEPRPAAQGDWRKCSRPTEQVVQRNLTRGIPRRWGWGGAGRGRVSGLSLCREGVAHSRGERWSLCDWTGLRRFQATGEGPPAPVVLSNCGCHSSSVL